MPLHYYKPVFRPPSEADSLLIQVTVGCHRPHCRFCFSSLSKKFLIREVSEIKNDLSSAKNIYRDQVKKIFFLGNDPLIIKTNDLIEIANYAYDLFPHLNQIALYSHSYTLFRKTTKELKELNNSGIALVYVGIESGNDEVLKNMKKGTTSHIQIQGCLKAIDAGFKMSCMIIIGLGGRSLSRAHAIDTGKVISAINPHYLGCLTLIIYPGTDLEKAVKNGEFETLSTSEVLSEMELMLKSMDICERDCVFRANHRSNYISIAGTLPNDKKKMLHDIHHAQENIQSLRHELFRGL